MLAEVYTKKARFLDAEINAKKAIKYAPFASSCSHYLLHNIYKISSFRVFKNKIKSFGEYLMSALTLPFDIVAMKKVKDSLAYTKFLPILLKGYIQVQTKGLDEALDIYIDAIDKRRGLFLYTVCLVIFIHHLVSLKTLSRNTKWQSGWIT